MDDNAADRTPDRGFRAVSAFEWQSVVVIAAMSVACLLVTSFEWESADGSHAGGKYIGILLLAGLGFGLLSLLSAYRLIGIVFRGRAATDAKGPTPVVRFINRLLGTAAGKR
ncbi:hypothetical protein NFI95_17170 [Acetobacteraceae bacterium KSS8]|uniref:Uncharacterized protein n=1 Tax=Endosaccharibacter trunci TaxID=2812733 RepID=A0ABT1WCN1_9PROT|nr:hypothetical protein [Acetobacteraceae bacterium KSS8]